MYLIFIAFQSASDEAAIEAIACHVINPNHKKPKQKNTNRTQLRLKMQRERERERERERTSWTRVESSWRSSTRSVSLSKALLCCCKSFESTTLSINPSSPPVSISFLRFDSICFLCESVCVNKDKENLRDRFKTLVFFLSFLFRINHSRLRELFDPTHISTREKLRT